MTKTTLSSRGLNQGVTKARKSTRQGPVFITDRAKPAHVLLSFEQNQKLTQRRRNIADALAIPGIEKIEFNPPPANPEIRPADFK